MIVDMMDLHTHTLVSGHAYNTRNEMIEAAKRKGLGILGITEHAPAMPGSCHSMYFMNYRALPRKHGDLTVLYGVELNILDFAGHLDLPDSVLKGMDIVFASLHIPCCAPGNERENTDAYIGAMANPYVNVIAHPDDARFPIDYQRLVRAAKERHVLLEVNNASLSPEGFRGDPRKQYKELLGLCAEEDVPVLISSDAHVDAAVGEHGYAWELLEQEGFPDELVVNAHPKMLREYVNAKWL